MISDETDHKGIGVTTETSNVLRFYLVFFFFALCALIYYFGELINFAGWDSLEGITFFFGVHDIHRLFFLIPIMYAAYYFGVRPSIIITILAIGVFIPRSLFLSPYPDPLLRTGIFTVFAGVIGYLFAVTSSGYKENRRRSQNPRLPDSGQS